MKRAHVKHLIGPLALLLASAAVALMVAVPAWAARTYPMAWPFGLPHMDRATFNRVAALDRRPFFWAEDSVNPGKLDPIELIVPATVKVPNSYVKGGTFTRMFAKIYRTMVEVRRREAVAAELNQGRVTLVETDMTKLSEEDRILAGYFARIGDKIDALYRTQRGTADLERKVPRDDRASRTLYVRNQGPECIAPKTQDDPFCNATFDFSKPVSFAYPPGLEHDQAFCDMLSRQPNARVLQDPFTVVRRAEQGSGFVGVPYNMVYGQQMGSIARELRAAAEAILTPEEAPLKAYLQAAAKGFETNVWWDADEAWSAMSGSSSKWYLRVGPDETYFDPCNLKSGFHMSLAIIDKTALRWQGRLTELREEMEASMADLIGTPYAAREVQFHLPEFINIVLNAGDSRNGLGGTVGQSLPNFGKVAAESRGRTVMMANLYSDPASMAVARAKAGSIFDQDAMGYWSDDPAVSALDIVLHEATHNFGPTGSWRVDAKPPEEIFGGRIDAILEETKAQTGSFTYLAFLAEKGDLDEHAVRSGMVASILWAFGQVSRGLHTATGKPKTYSHVGAIHLHALAESGALTFVDGGPTKEPGRYHVDWAKASETMNALMKTVGGIKARGDKPGAQALIAASTSEAALRGFRADLATARLLRHPRSSFLYRIKLE